MEAVPLSERTGLSCAEVAALNGMSEATVRRLVRDGVLARVRHTQRVVIARTEMERWLTDTAVAS
jgi:excisionase family DNA binding protein